MPAASSEAAAPRVHDNDAQRGEPAGSLLELFKQAIHAFYSHDEKPLLALMATDCLIISETGAIYHGTVEAQKAIAKRHSTPLLSMRESEFRFMNPDADRGDGAVLAGTYRLYSSPTDPLLFSVTQWVSAYFMRTQEGWKAHLLHFSNEDEQKVQQDLFPIETSRATYDYVRRILQAGRKAGVLPSRIVAKDGAQTHYLDPDGILYIRAQSKHCLIHGIHGERTANVLLGKLEEQLPGTFIRIHRSYLVNVSHIRSIVRNRIELADGTTLPIPKQRYEQIRREISLRVGDF